jgi:hypothetical protein
MLSPVHAAYQRDAVSVFPDLPKTAVADRSSAVLTAHLPWLAPSDLGELVGSGCNCLCDLMAPLKITFAQMRDMGVRELSLKVGDGGHREGGISWGCLTPPLPHRRSDMPCPRITSSS